MKDRNTLRRLLISNFSKTITEAVLQIIHVVFHQYVSFATKEQQKVIKVSFQYF